MFDKVGPFDNFFIVWVQACNLVYVVVQLMVVMLGRALQCFQTLSVPVQWQQKTWAINFSLRCNNRDFLGSLVKGLLIKDNVAQQK